MPLRWVHIHVADEHREALREALEHQDIVDMTVSELEGRLVRFALLIRTGATEDLLNLVDERFSASAGYRVVVLAVEAALPRPEEPEPVHGPDEDVPEGSRLATPRLRMRVSSEELFMDIEERIRRTPIFVALTVLSTIVAAVGLYTNNVAVVIGAMVIAPLLGPNVALALSTTLGDGALARRAAGTNMVGFAIAVGVSIIVGSLVPVDADVAELARRTQVGFPDIALALAAGGAGVLALTTGVSAALVGVMVAVALLPPTVAFGLFAGSQQWPEAQGALLLLLVNLICVNLAGVVMFLAQGVRPNVWWEEARAARATAFAIVVWVVLLGILGAAIWYA